MCDIMNEIGLYNMFTKYYTLLCNKFMKELNRYYLNKFVFCYDITKYILSYY